MSHAVYYFGAWGGTGHYLWTPDGRRTYDAPLPASLSRRHLDDSLFGDPALADLSGTRRGEPPRWPGDEAHQPQGVARLTHLDGWTVLGWWDRTGDQRFGSNSAFLARGTLTAEELARLGAETFPGVWARVAGMVLPPIRDDAGHWHSAAQHLGPA